MEYSDYEWIAAIIAAHPGGKVKGRKRLQKEVLLLQKLGLPTNYLYTIHFYGPYSEDLQSAIRLLESFDLIRENGTVTASGDTQYLIEETGKGHLPDASAFAPAIDAMANANTTIVELAATYIAYRDIGADHDQALTRVRRKKGSKCDNGNLEKALDLLNSIGLQQAA